MAGLFARPDLRLVDTHTVRIFPSADDVPRRLRLARDETVLVPDFEALERAVRAGADSAQVGVVPPDVAEEWIEVVARRELGAPIVPPEPFRFDERLLVVVPTYNERENLERLVERIRQHVVCDLLVVDDASPDGTGEIADALAAEHGGIHVLHRAGKQGLGKAYIAGFRWGLERGYDRLFEMDADFSHAPHDLPRLADASRSADLVIGSRYVRGGDTSGWTWPRRMLSRGGNLYAKMWLWLGLKDMTAGFRCYRAERLRQIDLGKISTDGYAFQIEMAWRTHRAGGSIREIPVHFVDRDAGSSKMSGHIALEAVRKVPRLRFSD